MLQFKMFLIPSGIALLPKVLSHSEYTGRKMTDASKFFVLF